MGLWQRGWIHDNIHCFSNCFGGELWNYKLALNSSCLQMTSLYLPMWLYCFIRSVCGVRVNECLLKTRLVVFLDTHTKKPESGISVCWLLILNRSPFLLSDYWRVAWSKAAKDLQERGAIFDNKNENSFPFFGHFCCILPFWWSCRKLQTLHGRILIKGVFTLNGGQTTFLFFTVKILPS